MSISKFGTLILLIAFGAGYVLERKQVQNLTEVLRVSQENEVSLKKQVSFLSSKLGKIETHDIHAQDALSQKIEVKKTEISTLQSQLDFLQNGGTRDYNGQDDHSKIQQRKEELKAIQDEIHGLEGEKRGRIQNWGNDSKRQKKSTQDYFKSQLQLTNTQINDEKMLIKGTQNSIADVKRTRPSDFTSRLFQLDAQLNQQKSQLDQFNQNKEQLKTSQQQASEATSSGQAFTEDLDTQISKAKVRASEVQRSLVELTQDSHRASDAIKSRNQQIDSFNQQLQVKKSELKDLENLKGSS